MPFVAGFSMLSAAGLWLRSRRREQ